MLSLFPTLLAFGLLGPFLLRVLLGIILIFWSQRRIRNRESGGKLAFAILEGIVGVLLVIGLFTQLAALIAAVVFIIKLIPKVRNKAFLSAGINYYFILLVISLSLLVLGPGAFAFDLPL